MRTTNTSEQRVTHTRLSLILVQNAELSVVSISCKGDWDDIICVSRVVCLFCKLKHRQTQCCCFICRDEIVPRTRVSALLSYSSSQPSVFVYALPPFCCVQPHGAMMPPPSPALPGINKQWAGPDARSSAKNSPAHQNDEQFPSDFEMEFDERAKQGPSLYTA